MALHELEKPKVENAQFDLIARKGNEHELAHLERLRADGKHVVEIEHDWRANRYHSPSDDLSQPMLKEEAVKLNGFVTALARRVADADARPQWLADSIFRKD